MTPGQIDRMAWSDWQDARKYADWRLGIKSAEDLNGEVEDFG